MNFKIQGEFIELCSLLKVTGLAENGGDAKQQIENKLVYVNGTVEERKRCKLKPGDIVEFNGKAITLT
jgi:ribosome-associated protein